MEKAKDDEIEARYAKKMEENEAKYAKEVEEMEARHAEPAERPAMCVCVCGKCRKGGVSPLASPLGSRSVATFNAKV